MQHRRRRSICCAVLVIESGMASAGEWRISPRFAVDETYSDNITLAHDPDTAGFITTLSPGFSLRGKSARLNANIDYNFQNLLFASNSKFDRDNQQLQGNTAWTVIDKWIFLDATGRMYQEAVDPAGNFIANSYSRIATQRDVAGYTVTPRLKHSFAGWVDVDFNYTLGHTDYSGLQPVTSIIDGVTSRTLGTGDDTSYRLRLASGRELDRTPLGLTVEHHEADYESGTKSKLDSIIGDIGYRLTRTVKLVGTGGHEEDTFSSISGAKNKGVTWTLGAEWTPSSRTFVALHGGERYFGPTFDAQVRHKFRKLSTTFSYKEEVRTISDLQNRLTFVPQFDQSGNPFYDPLQSALFRSPLNSPTVTEDTFVSRDSDLGFDYTFLRTTLQMHYFSSQRDYQRAKQTENIEAASGMLTRHTSLRGSLSLSAIWRHSDYSSANNSFDELVQISPSYNYTLGPHTIASLSYDYLTADGTDPTQKYTENAVTARINFYY